MEGLRTPKTRSKAEVRSSLEFYWSSLSKQILFRCYQKFPGKQSFISHFKQAHSDQMRPKTELAECEWFLSPDRPKPRPRVRREELKLRCPEACCGLLFASIHDVVAHVRTHTLCCPMCSGRFDGVEGLVQHVEALHGSPRIAEREFVEVFVEGVGHLQD